MRDVYHIGKLLCVHAKHFEINIYPQRLSIGERVLWAEHEKVCSPTDEEGMSERERNLSCWQNISPTGCLLDATKQRLVTIFRQ